MPLKSPRQTWTSAWDENWVFPNLVTGKLYWQEEIQKRHITAAATAVGLAETGWAHIPAQQPNAPGRNRRTHEGAAGTDATCQHPDNHKCFGQVLSDTKRKANSKVVRLVLKPQLRYVKTKREPQLQLPDRAIMNGVFGFATFLRFPVSS